MVSPVIPVDKSLIKNAHTFPISLIVTSSPSTVLAWDIFKSSSRSLMPVTANVLTAPAEIELTRIHFSPKSRAK